MESIRALVQSRFPGCTIEETSDLGVDAAADQATTKGRGYGRAVRVTLTEADGTRRTVVFHTARADDFGHDRRSDRFGEMVLAFDTYNHVPHHVPAVDVGVITRDGRLTSLVGATEAYLLTGWAEGELYANDLRRVATAGVSPRDLTRIDTLADYLFRLHARHVGRASTYTRAVRDLVGSGEGIFGMIDGFPDDVPGAPPERLQRIEERAAAWRWRLRGREPRLARVHGDFHPFNILFRNDTELSLLDASRGAAGDPADDVTALAINYVFFALDTPGAWERGLRALWHRLWSRYLRATGDDEVLEVAAPWLAWRALVVTNPRWYPDLSRNGRATVLGWIERALDAPRFDPSSADELGL